MKLNPQKQEGDGIHSGRKHPVVESVRDAKFDTKVQTVALNQRRQSTGQDKK